MQKILAPALFAIALVACSAPETRETAGARALAAPAASQVTVKDEHGQKYICNANESRTGSHMRKTECMTEEDYKRRTESSQQAVRKLQSKSAGSGPSSEPRL